MEKRLKLIKAKYNILKGQLPNYLRDITWENITVIFLFILLFLVFLSPNPMPFAPSIIGDNFVNFYILVAGVLAGILSLFIAVVILSFELTQKFHPDYTIKIFFNNFNLRELFVLYLGTVSICSFAVLYEKDLSELQLKNISLLIFILFLVALAVLLKYVKRIILASRPEEAIKKLVSFIDYWHIYANSYIPLRHRTRAKKVPNPLRILAEGAQYSIKDGRGRFARIILAEVTERLASELKNTNDKRAALKGFLPVYKKISESATQHLDLATASLIPDCFERIHHLLAKQKTKWSDFSELDSAFLEIFSRYAENNLEEQAVSAFGTLSRIFSYHLEFNCPAEDKIWSLDIKSKKIKHDTDIELQWGHVKDEYSNMIVGIIDGAKDGRVSRGIAFAGISRLEWLVRDVIHLGNLGVKQKKHIVEWLLFQISDNYLRLIRSDPKSVLRGFPLSPFTIKEIYSKYRDEEFVAMYYESIGNLTLDLVKLKSLNPFYLNLVAAEARGFMRKVGTAELVDKCIIYTIGVFEKIAEFCAQRVEQPYFKEVFVECHYLLKNLSAFGKGSPKKRALVTRRLNRFLKNTKSAVNYKKELESKRLSWKTITS